MESKYLAKGCSINVKSGVALALSLYFTSYSLQAGETVVTGKIEPPGVGVTTVDSEGFYIAAIIEALVQHSYEATAERDTVREGDENAGAKIDAPPYSMTKFFNGSVETSSSKDLISYEFHDAVKLTAMRTTYQDAQEDGLHEGYTITVKIENLRSWGAWEEIKYHCSHSKEENLCRLRSETTVTAAALRSSLSEAGIEVRGEYISGDAYRVTVSDLSSGLSSSILFDKRYVSVSKI